MKQSVLEALSAEELEYYVSALKLKLKAKSKAARIKEIQEAREHVAEINLAGETFLVPIKKAHDKRLQEKISGDIGSIEQLEDAAKFLLGEEQAEKFEELATDEDGTVDSEGYSVLLGLFLNSAELKNF